MTRPLALAVLLLLGLAPARAEDTIRIATEGAYPPFNYVENNEPAGFEVDLAKALCAAMKATCAVVLQDWDGMRAGLKERRYDAIMSSVEITEERRQRVAFSRHYYRIPGAIVGLKADTTATGTFPDIKGDRVGIVADSEFAEDLATTYPDALPRPFAKLDEAQLDLLTGRLDYVMGDKLALSRFLESREGQACCRFVADVPLVRNEGIGIAFRKTDTALRDRFDRAIESVIADGTYDRIRAKYIPFDIK